MDEQPLQGSWQAVKIDVGGKSVPADVVKTLKYVFDGDGVTLLEGDSPTGRGTFTLDPTKAPNTIDVVMIEGPEPGKRVFGIYAVDGDALTMCFGDERPAEFRGAGPAALVELRRDRPEER